MESVDIAEIQSSLRTLLREMKGEEAEKLLIDLPDDELAQLWQKGVIEGKSVEILIFMWTRLNYIFQTPSYLNLTKQPGETMLTLPHRTCRLMCALSLLVTPFLWPFLDLLTSFSVKFGG